MEGRAAPLLGSLTGRGGPAPAAEVVAGRQLSRLNRRWRVLWSIPVGRRPEELVDLVIGPAGVFTVTCVRHTGATVQVRGDEMTVNGVRVASVRTGRAAAGVAEQVLRRALSEPVDVRALVMVAGARRLGVRRQPRDHAVRVGTPVGTRRWLQSAARVLDDAGVERVFSAARRPGAWDDLPETLL